MRPFVILFSSLLLLSMNMPTLHGQTSVMTYNIKYDTGPGTPDNWDSRKGKVVALLRHYRPAFFGIQEGLLHQLAYMDGALPDYTFTGVGRDDGARKGEFSCIFYDSTQYILVQGSTFWLSPTPEEISVGWDAAMERICSYGLFEHRESGQRIWVFNTHFDHIGQEARRNSAALIIEQIQRLNADELPVVLMGDLNAEPDQAPIQVIREAMTDGMAAAHRPFYGPPGTFNGFDDRIMDRRIDYIFVDGVDVISYVHLDDRLDNNRHVSDHLPVVAKLRFPEKSRE